MKPISFIFSALKPFETALMAAFNPGLSPPAVNIPTLLLTAPPLKISAQNLTTDSIRHWRIFNRYSTVIIF
jgi:hypothetical protein